MRQDEREALAARIARAIAWRALASAERSVYLGRAIDLVAELEVADMETRAIAWMWVIGDDTEIPEEDE